MQEADGNHGLPAACTDGYASEPQLCVYLQVALGNKL